ncbi:BaiN/RdsA family NAD(P)/FAD-dependent oxidoreductase [Paratissierella segnis]|jgi:hypothetical protein|uniref:NAD(P)/FAD-dependent oxidoreductase n=1 Tax=Paratissierella segnis TaxID=2763679 RepID=A0A926ETJ5_9FIRM|nr:NAD(P)/FAD-dependent oxidoreductase [Paratissierella segnis]MBC8587978.1 NAD(P)/FAD-dependent oxidoreductase [Paratissierella segnis]
MANRIIIVGGGAAGMIAAIIAKRNGGDVTLLERNDRVGKKLLATGNGRCNYTNLNISSNNYHGKDLNFIKGPLSQFNTDSVIDFFEGLGITPAVEDNGKVYPLSFQSSSMLDVLRFEMEHLDVQLITDAYVVDIVKGKNFILKLKDGRIYEADRVILATGGMAMPVSGSDGNGHSLAKSLGHKIAETFPALVQLKLEGDIFKQVNGVKIIGKASVYHNEKLIREDIGDILFTDYGVSGPPILQISREAIEHINNNLEVELRLSIIYTKSFDELYFYLIKRFEMMPWKTVEEGLIGLINKRLIIPILKAADIDKKTYVDRLNKREIKDLANILMDWRFKIIGNKGWGQAQVTAGGVSTKEINDKTLESKLVKGLYIVGELLDVDGDCGGFNLQWAWSTGYIAGLNATL